MIFMKLILNFFLKILKIQILITLVFGSIIIKSQIFDNELNGNISNRDYTQERVDLSSINGPMPGRLPNLITPGPGISSEDSSQFEGIRLEDVNSFTVDKNKPSENGGESPLFKEPVRPTRMLPINTASELQDDYIVNHQKDENSTLIILLGTSLLVAIVLLLTNTEKMKITIGSFIGLFSITAFITHIWTAIIAFSNAGFWGGIFTLFLPFLGEIYWMIKMFGENDFYAFTALLHLILSIPLVFFRNVN